jgi:hypothetical protein
MTREITKEESDAVKEFLKKGGKIIKCPPNAITEDIVYKYKKPGKKKE